MLVLLRLLMTFWTVDSSAVTIPSGRVQLAAPRVASGLDATQPDEPRGSVTVEAFAIDRTEVTRGAYASCVLAGRCARREISWSELGSALPMTQVSWREAIAYCRALGERLPTEREWTRAARPDSRVYPWGDDLDCSHANWGNYEGEGRCPANPGRPVAVASYPSGASADGVHDLAGNVWEWTADLFEPHHVERGPEELGRAPRRSVRGGACCSILAAPRIDNRVGWPEDYRDADLGFRCAR